MIRGVRRIVVAAHLGLVAQLGLTPTVSGQTASAGALVQTYRLSGSPDTGPEDIQLVTAPFSALWRQGAFQLEVEGAYAAGILTMPAGGYVEINGPTDMRVGARLDVGVLSVAAFTDIPTGRSSYETSEFPLLGALESDLLPFAIERWGSGGAVGGDVGVSVGRGPWAARLGVGYVQTRELTPWEGNGAVYSPGSQVRVRAMVDRWLGDASVVSLLAGYQRFADDVVEGLDVYRSGPRLEAQLSLTHAIGARESVSAYGRLYLGSEGLLAELSRVTTSPVVGITGSPGRRLMVLGLNAQAVRDRFSVLPDLELRALSTDDGLGAGWLGSLGGSVDYRVLGERFGRHLVASPYARVHVGSVETASDVVSSVLGWQAGLAVRWEAGR